MKLFLTLILSLSFTASFSQLRCPSPFGKNSLNDAKRNHVSVSVGFSKLNGDINKNNALGLDYTINYDYQIGRGIYVGAEAQFGSLEIAPKYYDKRSVQNDYTSLGARATFYPFQILMMEDRRADFKKRFIEGLYVGIGFAHLWNNYKSIYRDVNWFESWGPIDYYANNGAPVFKDKTTSIILPTLDFGLSVPLRNTTNYSGSYFSMFINMEMSFSRNEYLDGYTPLYNDKTPVNFDNDMYNLYSAGLRYSF